MTSKLILAKDVHLSPLCLYACMRGMHVDKLVSWSADMGSLNMLHIYLLDILFMHFKSTGSEEKAKVFSNIHGWL